MEDHLNAIDTVVCPFRNRVSYLTSDTVLALLVPRFHDYMNEWHQSLLLCRPSDAALVARVLGSATEFSVGGMCACGCAAS